MYDTFCTVEEILFENSEIDVLFMLQREFFFAGEEKKQ